ncbi:hypothetical protein LUZ60_014353 [Juncus effusus]|nr:hypothetical protein LUZ60_014353 [Juncus effusus]
MASLCHLHLISTSSLTHHRSVPSFSSSIFSPPLRAKTSFLKKPMALGQDLLGDFGARDPFPAEIESNFGDKVLGGYDTLHRILIPTLSAISLSQMIIDPSNELLLSREDATKLLKKIIGWRLAEIEGILRLQCEWKLRDGACGEELINRINKVLEGSGHYPSLSLEQPNIVRAELYSSSIGGVSINDFIIAAKIDTVKCTDLLPRKRVWA